MTDNTDNLTPLSKEELDDLSNDALCQRMELVLLKILNESYPNLATIDNFPRQSIKDFFNTRKIQSLSQENQRRALRKCFEYLVQLETLSRVSGWMNQSVFNSDYDEIKSWLSPRIQSINCSIDHIKIVCSGVAFERLMDLLHIIETGKPVESNKSKFKKFKKWLLNRQNRFVYFATILPAINKFRSSLRTAEIHEWSRLPEKLLQLQSPSFEESNEPLTLLNILMTVWDPLLILLNDKIPDYIVGSIESLKWLQAIKNNDVLTMRRAIILLFILKLSTKPLALI